MGEFLIDDDTFDELRVLDGATSLGDDLDKVEVDILTVEVCDVEDRLHGQVSEVILALAHDLGSKSGGCTLSQELIVVLLDIKLFLHFEGSGDSDVTSALETISNLQWVDALIEELLGLLKDGAGKDDNTSSTITNLIVLGGREFCEKFGGLMVDLCDSNDVRQQY